MRMACRYGLVLTLLLAAPARADWVEASSDHFVLYGEQEPETIRAFAESLERFHAALAHVFGTGRAKPSPSNRVTIFVLDAQQDVQRLSGMDDDGLQGFYRASAGNSVAVVRKLGKRTYSYQMSSQTLLLHEYAHHFLSGMTSRTYPRWISEGFAEFYAGVKFADDGGLTLGIPPTFRGQEYLYAKKVPIRRLLDYDGGYSDYADEFNAFYVQSWALFHYLRFDPARKGQSRTFETLLNEGVSALDAAGRAFGDLDRLATEVEDYVRRRRLPIATIPPGALQVSAIELRQLRPGEAAMVPVVAAARVGVSTEAAARLVPTARAIAQRYADDPAVLAALAEVELAAGSDDAAIAAADRALAIDPNNVIALIQKGHALARKAEAAGTAPMAWMQVRQQFLKANRVENDHPVPLVGYYLAYLKEGRAAPKNAVEGLEWAMQLAPFDPTLRWLVAEQMVREERWQEAARALSPLAYSAHQGAGTQRALALLKEVEAKAAAQASEAATAAAGP